MLLIRTLTILCLLITLGTAVSAQSQGQTRPAPTNLALEIHYFKAAPPAYQTVPPVSSKPSGSGAWYARFGRVENWQLPAGELPIRAVNVVSRLDGEMVMLRVSVFRGLRFHDQETTVATYELRENETVVVKDLERFGVEPFRIAVVRVVPATASQPVVRSRAKSLEVIAIELLNSTLPTYKLTLRNLSDQNIRAIKIDVFDAGRTSLTSMPRGRDGLPLIAAGEFYESIQPLVTRARPAAGGYVPASSATQETVISSVVFEDGSYEGEPEPVAQFKASTLGQRSALTKLVAIFGAMDQSSTEDQEGRAQIKWFRDQVLAISNQIDESALSKLHQEFSVRDDKKKADLRSWAEVNVHFIRKELLTELDALEKGAFDQSSFRSWLLNTRSRYQSWLSRL